MSVSRQHAATTKVLASERHASHVRPHAPLTWSIDRRRGDTVLRRLLAAGDAIAVLVALSLALTLPGLSTPGHRLLWGLIAVPLMILLFKLYGLYDRDVKRITYSTVDDLPWLFHATVGGSLLLWLFSKVTPLHQLDLAEIVAYGLLVLLLVTCARFSVRFVAARVLGPEAALLVGGGDMADLLVRKLSAHPAYRSKVVGVLADRRSAVAVPDGLPILGSREELDEVAAQHKVGRVIVSPGEIDDRELEELLRRCRALALKVSVLPGLSDVLGPSVEVDDVEGVTVLGINPPWLPRSSRALKRVMDLAIATALLVAAAPILMIIAIAVKLDSRGPVLFAQDRIGKAGKRFRLFKFRTMVLNAEQRRDELLTQSTDPHWLKLEHDPRITRAGRFLRRLSLDELPQLWNVLRGQMSMVGPRPLIADEDERVTGWARGRLDLTPGITGYWQVSGRTRIPFEEMVKLDYLYVMNWSLWEDVRLMLRTLPATFRGTGAN
jgi:exopolysaccharide biosynthesis polyprenyl glycosylphosphotransferase